MPGAVAGQSAKFRAVISADQQSFALRRLPGPAAAGQVAVLIFLDLMTAFVVGIAIPMVVPGRLQDLPFGVTHEAQWPVTCNADRQTGPA